ncbi:MAG TPA: hypothetical protein VFU85_14040 [Nocardioides sp.]|nr:hypothetical protein [Nocardioides sp.]
MDLIAVMDEIGDALAAIPDLRVKSYTESRIIPPVVMVALPRRYPFDQTMGRGSDEIEIPIVLFVGRVDAGSALRSLGRYVAGSGEYSIKEAIEKHLPVAFDVAHVLDVSFVVATVATVDFLTATFRCRVFGPGEG